MMPWIILSAIMERIKPYRIRDLDGLLYHQENDRSEWYDGTTQAWINTKTRSEITLMAKGEKKPFGKVKESLESI